MIRNKHILKKKVDDYLKDDLDVSPSEYGKIRKSLIKQYLKSNPPPKYKKYGKSKPVKSKATNRNKQ